MAYTTIKKPSDYFNTKLYTGNGSNGNAITGVGFQPDWVWIKDRDGTEQHALFDVVRGVYNELNTNATQEDQEKTDTLISFDSDGYSLNDRALVNGSGVSYASWNWLASNTTASNTDGSITSTVSANTTSGFSIVSYTGTGANATVGHSLGSVAKMIIVKRRDTTGRWQVYHNGLGATKYLFLDGTETEQTNSNRWNDTTPTSSVFSLGSSAEVNASGGTYIAYCFADVKGFSKFGSYTGNGNSDGTFVYTGFKPAFFLVKAIDSVQDWFIYDIKRDSYNVMQRRLRPAQTEAENTNVAYYMDFLSNGFKFKATNAGFNGSGVNYIYMAFAEEPLVGDNPATAR